MTPSQIITEARNITQDTTISYRNSEDELLEYVNQGLREACVINPALFSTVISFPCVAGQCEQTLNATDSAALIEVLCVTNGRAVTPFDFNAMNAFNPSWRTDTAGEAQQWSKFANDPRRFFIYPKAPASQNLDVRHAKVPATYGLNDTIAELPDVYKPALAKYVISRVEVKDDEHALAQRSAQMYAEYVAQIKG